MEDVPAPRPDSSRPSPGPGLPAPSSVRYAQLVLFLQGGIWALGSIAGVIGVAGAVVSDQHRDQWVLVAAAVGWSGFAGGMATVKMLLAVRLGRGRSGRVRKVVIAAELAMTCFGLLWFFGEAYTATGLPADMVALAGLVGAGLSLVAALVLMRRHARQHAASHAARLSITGRGPATGPTSFWQQSALARA
jgi:drug/metabolite transporter (DMT)-like permease